MSAKVAPTLLGIPNDSQRLIFEFLSFQDQARAAPTCKFVAALSKESSKERFLRAIGAPTSTESADPRFDTDREGLLSQRLQKLPALLKERHFAVLDRKGLKIQSIDRVSFLDQLLYYFGYHHARLAQNLMSLSSKRVSQADEFLASPAPATLIELRNVCRRVRIFSKEIEGMYTGLKKDQTSLDEATNKLCFLVRHICRFIQCLIRYKMGASGVLAQMSNSYEQLNGKKIGMDFIPRLKGKLEKVIRGNLSCPYVSYELCIGRTSFIINTQEHVSNIYAYPLFRRRNNPKIGRQEFIFTGGVCFVLSPDGKDGSRYGSFVLRRCWKEDGFPLSYVEEENRGADEQHTQNLRGKRLLVEGMEDYYCGYADFDHPGLDPNGDRPERRKIIQLIVEIAAREKGRFVVDFQSSYDQAYTFTAGGFESPSRNVLWEEIREARKSGKKFPDYVNKQGFLMQLKKPQNGTMLDIPVDFGEGLTTWGEIIQQAPILQSKGPILPDFWETDLFVYERPEA